MSVVVDNYHCMVYPTIEREARFCACVIASVEKNGGRGAAFPTFLRAL